jgi:hypothetical protein
MASERDTARDLLHALLREQEATGTKMAANDCYTDAFHAGGPHNVGKDVLDAVAAMRAAADDVLRERRCELTVLAASLPEPRRSTRPSREPGRVRECDVQRGDRPAQRDCSFAHPARKRTRRRCGWRALSLANAGGNSGEREPTPPPRLSAVAREPGLLERRGAERATESD